MEYEVSHYLALMLFGSFIGLLFTGFPVAWIMGGLAILFTAISVMADTYFDTFIGLDWGYANIVIARIYAVMNNWILVALPIPARRRATRRSLPVKLVFSFRRWS